LKGVALKEYKQMNLEERGRLFVMRQEGLGLNEIAQQLGRHRSTIHRELSRNKDGQFGYLPDTAHKKATTRKARHGSKIDRDPDLKKKIIEWLVAKWSPEMISGRLRQANDAVYVCAESIYCFIYSDSGRELKLYIYLVRARPRRGLRGGRKPRNIIPNRVSIHDRPAHIATKEEFGHQEGDLTFFSKNQSMNLGVTIEKKTRYVNLFLSNSKQTTEVVKNMFNSLATMPKEARKSMTFGNGVEFTRHGLLKQFMGIDTYFCDKHSPWQKGQVEQMNSVLHQFLPKKTNIAKITLGDVRMVQDKLNNMPRKCLGFKTPAEALLNELSSLGRVGEASLACCGGILC
jgi:transposase, IS30 family